MKKKGMAVKVFFLLAGLLALTLSVSAAEVFQFEVSGNKVLNGFFSSIGGPITVEWGDGTQNTFSGEEQRYVKDYGKSFTGKVTVRVPEGAAVTGFRMETSGAKVRFALADLPKKLTYLHCGGLNSVYGNLSDLPPAMDYYYCEGNNTVTGNLKDLPRTLRNFNTHGRNTIRGDFSDGTEPPYNLAALHFITVKSRSHKKAWPLFARIYIPVSHFESRPSFNLDRQISDFCFGHFIFPLC